MILVPVDSVRAVAIECPLGKLSICMMRSSGDNSQLHTREVHSCSAAVRHRECIEFHAELVLQAGALDRVHMLEHKVRRKGLHQREVVWDNEPLTGQDKLSLEPVDSDAYDVDRMLEPVIDDRVEHKPCFPYS